MKIAEKNMLKNIENNILSRENARTKAGRQNLKPERKKCGFWSSYIGIVTEKFQKCREKRKLIVDFGSKAKVNRSSRYLASSI